MMRWVLLDYISVFRWRNVKEQWKYGTGSLAFYILLLQPLMSTGYGMDERTLAAFLVNLPMAFALFGAMPQLMGLPKLMYLCPLSTDMRREYLIKAGAVRIVAPVLAGLPGILWVFAKGRLDGIAVIGTLINLLLFTVVFAVWKHADDYAKKVNGHQQGTPGLDHIFGARRVLSIVVILVDNFLYVSVNGKEGKLWVNMIAVGLTLVVQLPLTISCIREWPKAIERAVSYESSGAIWSSRERTGR